MNRKMSNVFSFLLVLLFASSPAHAVYQDQEVNQQPQYISNQVIVNYKQGQSPVELQSSAKQEAGRNQTIVGRFQNFINNGVAIYNFIFTGEKYESPAAKLSQIEQAMTNLGVVSQEQLFIPKVLGNDIPEELQRFFVYQTDGAIPIEQVIKDFANLAQVESVEPNYILRALVLPNDTFYNESNPVMWNLTNIEMPQAWDQTTGSEDVVVAVIDSGISMSHEDFAGRQFLPGRDYATCDIISSQGGQLVCLSFKNCPKTSQGYCDDDPTDDLGHGSHVAGTIAAVANNQKGIAPVAWNVKILPVKVLNATGVTLSTWTYSAIQYAVDQGAKVINLSLGRQDSCDNAYQEVINYATSKGVTVVVAAGNDSHDAINDTPASCNGVIAVGATGPNDERAVYSNYGSTVDISAPGGNASVDINGDGELDSKDCINSECIISTFPPNSYKAWEGTSMAAPHVAGAAALLISLNSSLTPSSIEQILKNTGDGVASDQPDQPIGKRLNVNQALLSVAGTPTASGSPTNTPIPTITTGESSLNPTLTRPISPPSITARPTPPSHPCPYQAITGDYNCDDQVNNSDFDSWKADYLEAKTTLEYFEYIRRILY